MFLIKIYIKEYYINYYDRSIQMCGQYCILAPSSIWAKDDMVIPFGVLKDTLESNNPTKFEADRPNGCEVTANRVFLKGPSKATSSLSL